MPLGQSEANPVAAVGIVLETDVEVVVEEADGRAATSFFAPQTLELEVPVPRSDLA